MIRAIAILLGFQLAGEVTARALGLSLPGPVLGFAALFVAFLVWPPLHAMLAETARGLLAHLSLLFVPAGVGVVGHISSLGAQSAAVLAAIIASTALAIAVGAGTFVLVDRATRR
ncbi:CidA/LrgA family protein [Maritimibacter sp. UBA3975]|uniref:CidA/LrgA family protein n=1 Tax=Maritimibacter sp. UBA3975 TaxID=1946833 RepID=UPI000C09BB1C|nr:CidA/LrgA family protein [Maritimibacter sp. UBA3975]MAM63737.1 hypothetical protein [Maritimibacter sp.]|tara:strand:- start:32026 stop:32370 length:345 start_codon:yes stop_codon:yes gene_type:complete